MIRRDRTLGELLQRDDWEENLYFGSIEARGFQRFGDLLGDYWLNDGIFEVFDLRIAENSRNTRLQFAAFKCDSSPFTRTSATERRISSP